MYDHHRLSEADRKLLESDALSYRFPPIPMAVLQEAVAHHLESKQRLLNLIEHASISKTRKSLASRMIMLSWLPRIYWEVLHDSKSTSLKADSLEIKRLLHDIAPGAPANRFQAAERQLLIACMASRSLEERANAGQVLIEKEHLNRSDLDWAHRVILREIARSPAQAKRYWKYLERVLVAMNPS